jgi:hypothetical protein
MLEPHADAAVVLEVYRAERDAIRRSHLQVIWLLLAGERLATVSRVFACERLRPTLDHEAGRTLEHRGV